MIEHTFAYADPPYLGCGAKLYGNFHSDAADWDDPQMHRDLMEYLVDSFPDGWAISLHTPSLPLYVSLMPNDARVGAWVKTWHQIRPTTTQFAWEPVIWRTSVKDGKRSPMVRDWYAGAATRKRGLPGAKPEGFNRWVLNLLGFDPYTDKLLDMFPGTGGMERTINQLTLDWQPVDNPVDHSSTDA